MFLYAYTVNFVLSPYKKLNNERYHIRNKLYLFIMTEVVINYSDIIKNQATVNIGCIGHVSEGKSTIVKALTGTSTLRHQKEQEVGKTIKLGYANFKIWYCNSEDKLYYTPSNVMKKTTDSGEDMVLIKHVSFVDCPGHESYMTTMIGGTSVMDCAFLLIGANNETVPQKQTHEHLMVLNNTDVSNILVLQNKLDLLKTEEDARKNYDKIKEYIKTTNAKDSVILPVSAQLQINIDEICRYVAHKIDVTDKAINDDLFLPVVRSFDINKPGTPYSKLEGGVIGGSIVKGVLKVGDYIEIRPGISKTVSGKKVWTPLITRVESICSEKNKLDFAVPGGLIGIGTTMDPYFCSQNHIVGQIVGHVGKMPAMYERLTVEIEQELIPKSGAYDYKKDEEVIICINNYITKANIGLKKVNKQDLVDMLESGSILESKNRKLYIDLPNIVCCKVGSKIAILKSVHGKFTLANVAKIVSGLASKNIVQHVDYDKYINNDATKYRINYDIDYQPNDSEFSYDDLLANFTFNKRNDKFVVTPPEVSRKDKKTYVHNILKIMRQLHGENPVYDYNTLMIKFFSEELVKLCRLDGDNNLVIDGLFRPPQIFSILRQYIEKYVLCKICKSNSTQIVKIHTMNKIKCNECSAMIDAVI